MSKTREIIEKLKEEAIRAFDENENGQLDITDVLVKAMKTPGVRIDRTEFLKEVLPEFCSEAKTAEAIATSPVQAGIKEAVLDKIADRLIITERKVATASSAGLAIIPGGIGMQVATTLLDTTQYYVILVRLLQKLLYLYGFPQLGIDNGDDTFVIDTATINIFTLCLGSMYGNQEAVRGLRMTAQLFASKTDMFAIRENVNSGEIHELIVKVFNKLSLDVSRDIIAKLISNLLGLVGGLLCGGITFINFDSSFKNIKYVLKDTPLFRQQ